jgi:hypothetical protein
MNEYDTQRFILAIGRFLLDWWRHYKAMVRFQIIPLVVFWFAFLVGNHPLQWIALAAIFLIMVQCGIAVIRDNRREARTLRHAACLAHITALEADLVLPLDEWLAPQEAMQAAREAAQARLAHNVAALADAMHASLPTASEWTAAMQVMTGLQPTSRPAVIVPPKGGSGTVPAKKYTDASE